MPSLAAAADPSGVGLTANLVEPERNTPKGAATVSVNVTGVSLTDPATTGEMPKPGQAHLHYQVDNGPVVATTTPKLSFHGLKPGDHQIVVMLAANDHTPLGPKQTLSVSVPDSANY
jgi:hypothetical protein